MKKVILFLSAAGVGALFTTGVILGESDSSQNEQDLQGIQTVKGDHRNTIYRGMVAPPASLGNIGDFYLNTSESNLYGPKTTDGWGIPVSLDGADVTEVAGTPVSGSTAKAVANMNRDVLGDYSFFTTR
ncbi:hypothetical protein [Proteiniphilum sp. X52]|uniref:hypothetical protein n=1 Tax=Proteiniphilum sp. X52 TaxID=2382159 RepID=UPI000F0A6A83|nr:hypothetical protein [Proteiniphilum sp. X52]RNC65668.1 hypothetical protein D7D25_05850 [Proteiniphilum sp. X52]